MSVFKQLALAVLLLWQCCATQAQDDLPRMDYFNLAFHKTFFDVNGEHSPWELKEHDCGADMPPSLLAAFADVPKQSQSHLLAMLKSNMRLGVFTLTVPEKEYFLTSGLNAENFKVVTNCLGGYERASKAILSEDIRYFEELAMYFRYLKALEEKPYYQMGRKYAFKIVRSTKDLDEVIADPTKIGGLFSVFGAHNLSSYFYIKNDLLNSEAFRKVVLQNLERLKGIRPMVEHTEEYLDIPVLFLSIAGSFRNGFGGDTRGSLLANEEGSIYKESINAHAKLTAIGQELVKKMLDRKDGRRILVDVAGLSIEARNWIYDYYAGLRYQGDTIPVLAIGSCVHGESWNHSKMENQRHNEGLHLPIKGDGMAREDLQNILESGGLLSIPLDQTQLTKQSKWETILKEQIVGSAEYRETVVKLVLSHVLRSIYVAQDREMWDHLSICTTFDGVNRPFPQYANASQVRDLADDIKLFLEEPKDIENLYTVKQIKQLMYDYSAEEITEKLLSTNALNFTRKQLERLEQNESSQETVDKE